MIRFLNFYWRLSGISVLLLYVLVRGCYILFSLKTVVNNKSGFVNIHLCLSGLIIFLLAVFFLTTNKSFVLC